MSDDSTSQDQEEMDADELRHEAQWRDAVRRRRIFARVRKHWTTAKVTPNGLKPFAHLCQNVAAQSGGAVQEKTFWSVVIQSIRDGYFDGEHRLFLIERGRMRITAAKLKEVPQWDADALLQQMVSRTFASVSTLAAWAKAYHYNPPDLWLQVLTQPVAPPTQFPRQSTGRKLQAVIASLKRLSLPSTASQDEILDAVNRDLTARGEHTASPGTLKNARSEIKRLRQNNCGDRD